MKLTVLNTVLTWVPHTTVTVHFMNDELLFVSPPLKAHIESLLYCVDPPLPLSSFASLSLFAPL